MLYARRLLNTVLEAYLAERDSRVLTFDRAFFRCVAELGMFAGIKDAEVLKDPWALEAIAILCESVLNTRYGAPLELVTPLIATLETTNVCKRGCRVCYSDSLPRPESMSEISLELVESLARTRVPAFLLSGGEPLQHPQIGAILNALLSHQKMVSVATATFSYELADIFREHPNNVTLIYSFWGGPHRHNTIRGHTSYETTIRLIQELSALPVYCTVNYVSPWGYDDPLDGLSDIIVALPSIHRIYVSREIAVGRSAAHADVQDSAKLEKACTAIERKTGRKILMTVPRPPQSRPELGVWSTIISRLFGIEWPVGCGAGNWAMHIRANGDVSPCFAHAARVANVRERGIAESWQAVQKLPHHPAAACSAEAEIPIKSPLPIWS